MRINECSCKECIECCWRNPGWFGSIQEVKGAANIMNMSPQEFAQEYLIQEWWAGEKAHISIPAPRRDFTRDSTSEKDSSSYSILMEDRQEEMANNGEGFIRATWGHNLLAGFACIFLTDKNRCLIHESKPKECRRVFGCRDEKQDRFSLVLYWEKQQNFIKELLEPVKRNHI